MGRTAWDAQFRDKAQALAPTGIAMSRIWAWGAWFRDEARALGSTSMALLSVLRPARSRLATIERAAGVFSARPLARSITRGPIADLG